MPAEDHALYHLIVSKNLLAGRNPSVYTINIVFSIIHGKCLPTKFKIPCTYVYWS